MENNNKLTKIKETFTNGLWAVGNKLERFAISVVRDNAPMVVLAPVAVGAVLETGIGIGSTKYNIYEENQKQQVAYEQTVDEIAEKRNKIAAIVDGFEIPDEHEATENVLSAYDELHPQPKKPTEKEVTIGEYAKNGLGFGLFGAIAGVGVGLAGVAGTAVVGAVGMGLEAAGTAVKKKEDENCDECDEIKAVEDIEQYR
jgi:hypothetical protein